MIFSLGYDCHSEGDQGYVVDYKDFVDVHVLDEAYNED